MARSSESAKPRLVVDSEAEGGVGAILRGARLARGEELREVASALRIRLPYLEALEDGRLDELPGMTYGIGFVRAYADHVELDSADMILRFKVEARSINRRTELQFPEPLPSNRVPSGALLLIALLLAGGVYAGWFYSTSQDMTLVEAIEQVPERLLNLGDDAEPATESVVAPVVAASPAEPDAAAADEVPPPAAEVEATVAEITDAESTEAEVAGVVTDELAPVAEEAARPLAEAAEEAPELTSEQTVETAADLVPDSAANGAVEASSASANEDAVPGQAPEAVAETVPETVAEAVAETVPEVATDAVPSETPAEVPPVEADVTVGAIAEASVDPTGAPAIPDPAAAEPQTPELQTSELQTSEDDGLPEIAAAPVPEIVEETLPPPPAPETRPAPEEEVAVAAEEAEPAVSEGDAQAGAIVEEELPPPTVLEESGEAGVAPEANAALETTAPSGAATAEADATPTAEESVAAAPPARARIILQATSESWIRVTDAEGDVLIEKLLLMGEIYRVPNRDGLLLDTGNAGALKVLIDGRPAPSLGDDGAIIRNISLTPDALGG